MNILSGPVHFFSGKTRKKGVQYTIIRRTNFFFFDDITSILTYRCNIANSLAAL